MTPVIIKAQYPDMRDGMLVEWYAADGDNVAEGEPLYCLDIVKMAMDIDAPASGALHIIVASSSPVVVGQRIAEIE